MHQAERRSGNKDDVFKNGTNEINKKLHYHNITQVI